MSESYGTSVGELLRSAREGKRLTLDAVNRETKISVGVLSSLEQDDFDALGNDIYLKGFLRAYARFLGLDFDQIIRVLDKQRGGRGARGAGTMWDIEESVKEEKLESPRIFKRFGLPLLFLVILVLILLFANERKKVKRLSIEEGQGRTGSEIVESRYT
jgi:cytoskeletal protein RodZ